jgi:hypothetical protein
MNPAGLLQYYEWKLAFSQPQRAELHNPPTAGPGHLSQPEWKNGSESGGALRRSPSVAGWVPLLLDADSSIFVGQTRSRHD